MTNEKDRTERRPIPMSEDEAERVVGGDGANAYEPCGRPDCSCLYSNAANCSCQGHSHVG